MPLARGGWLVDNSGVLQGTLSGGAAVFLNGANLKSDGTVCVASEASQSRRTVGGLSYDSSGNLIVDSAGGISVTLNGFPLTAAGAIAVSSSSVDHIGPAGLAVDSTGRVVTAGLIGPNRFTSPNQLDTNAPDSWTLFGATTTPNAVQAPDGSSTAATETLAAGSNFQQANCGGTLVNANGTWQWTVFVKNISGLDFIGLYISGANASRFQLSTLSATNSGTGVGVATAAANGYVKLVLTTVSSNGDSLIFKFGNSLANAVQGVSWTAAGTESLGLWGMYLGQVA